MACVVHQLGYEVCYQGLARSFKLGYEARDLVCESKLFQIRKVLLLARASLQVATFKL